MGLHLIVAETVLGSMVELAVVCAATKLAKSATATVDFANIFEMCEFENLRATQLMFFLEETEDEMMEEDDAT